MANSPNAPGERNNRLGKEYEDPHYHDDDEDVPLDDARPRTVQPPQGRKPARRLPPPKRRFYEE